jgi:hypothetical protein
MKIGLVGCVKQKRAVAASAEDLYTSPLFCGRRRYVERTCDDWFILSAKHGLVDKDQVLEPYDVTLKTASTGERRQWSRGVLAALGARLGDLSSMTFEIHAGSEYRDCGLPSGLVVAGDRCFALPGVTRAWWVNEHSGPRSRARVWERRVAGRRLQPSHLLVRFRR